MRKKKEPGNALSSVEPSSCGHYSRCFPVASGPGARSVAAALVLSTLFFSAAGLAAKEKKVSKTITGVVLDSAEDPIPGATVELTDVQAGKKHAIYAQEGGRYQFSDLATTHDYEVRAVYKGASSDVRKVSSLDDRQTVVMNLRIPAAKN